MAGEEDVELRDLVAQTLEAKGVLGKIRAQLRASVFLALEEQSQEKRHPLVNENLREYLKTKDGQVVASLVREFMEFFELDFTCSVFDPETSVLDTYPGREKLARDIGLDPRATPNAPLLAGLLQQSSHSAVSRQLRFPDPSHLKSTQASVPPLVLTGSTRTSTMTTTTAQTSLATSAKTTTASAAVFSEVPPLARTETTVSSASTRWSAESRIVDSKFNRNENSNLGRVELKVGDLGTKPQTDREAQPTDLSKMSGLSVGGLGVHAELGEKAESSSLNVGKLLNSSKSIDELLKRPTGEPSRDELDEFLDKPLPSALDAVFKEGEKAVTSRPLPPHTSASKPHSSLEGAPILSPSPLSLAGITTRQPVGKGLDSGIGKFTGADGSTLHDDLHSDGGGMGNISEDLSHISSLASGKYETTDLTLSQNSLTGDFDYTEPAQS